MDLSRTLNILEGQFAYGGEGGLTSDLTAVSEPYATDWVYRHEGLQKAIYNYNLIELALSSKEEPRKAYVELKRNNLNGIAINLRDIFKREYKRYLEAGVTQEAAKKQANKFATEYKKQAMQMHDEQFPSDFSYDRVMKMLTVKKKGVESGGKSHLDF